MASSGSNRFKVVAFDLDGTLADTADLSTTRRRPALVLRSCRADQKPTALEFSRQVSELPSKVMQRGAIVAVVTRAPFAYGATLSYLLGLDYNALLTSQSGRSVEDRLTKLIAGASIEPSELLYVGDRDADKAAADAVGATFTFAPWLAGDTRNTGNIEAAAAPTSLLNDSAHPIYHPQSLLKALRRSARTGGSIADSALAGLVSANLDEELRSALAWMLLRSAPGQVRRRELQTIAFATVPASGYDCVIPRRIEYGLACVSRSVMRHLEYTTDATKRDDYFALLRHLHPLWQITTSRMTFDHPNVPVFSFRRFHDQRGGELLRTAKNWGGPGKGEAGPEVVLSLIELPTVVIAAQLAADPTPTPIVPLPASPCTASKPGQVSQRIAIDAALLSGRDYLDVLIKTSAGIVCTVQGHGRTVTVVDDQLTTGISASNAVTALTAAGFRVRAVVTWSASRRHWTGAPSVTTRCWLADARWLLGRSGNCGPQHRQAPTQYAHDVANYLNSIRT